MYGDSFPIHSLNVLT